MWAIINNTPFEAESCWVRDKNGAEVWLVAVRGTFLIRPDGSTQPAKEQTPVCLAPKYRGEVQTSSLLYDSDLNHKKAATDVLLHGHAYSPGNKPVTEVDVTLKIGGIEKTLRVIGDRIFQSGVFGVSMSRPEPFVKMPITYERAYGGTDTVLEDPKKHTWDERNPVGVGFAIDSNHLHGKPAPNIENPRSLFSLGSRRPAPAGFGPIPGHCQPRLKLAGTYDEKWEREKMPLLPEDFDERFYQCAPPDQQVPGFLKGGEAVELHNLTSTGVLKFRLPRVRLLFQTFFDGEGEARHHAELHSVILEPDEPRVILVWHTHLPCHHQVLKLLNTSIDILRRVKVSAEEKASGVWTGADEDSDE